MKAVVIQGPTGVGKSLIAHALAKVLKSSIVLADSIQLYSGFQIAANKPSSQMRNSVKYHLLDNYDPTIFTSNSPLTVWKYREDALTVMRQEWAERRVPIIEGGSYFYLKCLLHGKDQDAVMQISPETRVKARSLLAPLKPDWDKSLEFVRNSFPHLVLDMDRNDFYRLEKAVTLALAGKESGFQMFRDAPLFDARIFYFDLGNLSLHKANCYRCEKLVESGLVEEVVDLLVSKQFNWREANTKMPENSIGYAEAFVYIRRLLQYMKLGELKETVLLTAFYDFLASYISNTHMCVKNQRKAFRLAIDEFVYVPLNLDSFSQLPINTLVTYVKDLVEQPRSLYESHRGGSGKHFQSRLELEHRLHWSIYPRHTPSFALSTIDRHVTKLELHKSQLSDLGL